MTDPQMSPSQTPADMPDPDSRDARRQRRHERRAMRRDRIGGPAVGGVILLLIGAVLLAQNLGWHPPDNWWAAFLLIPAAGSLIAAIRGYNEDGRMTGRVTGALAAGLIFLVLACALYFGVNWGIFWPIVLMLIGAGLMFRSYWPN